LPLEVEEAAATLLDAGPADLDLLQTDDGVLAVNALHTGIGVTAAERATGLKPVLGDTAYPVGALIAGLTERGWDLAVHLDDAPLSPQGPTLMVAVLNGTGVGGGARLAPEARPDDGALDVVVSTATGPAARAAFAAALQSGSHAGRDDVVVARGKHVEISGESASYNVDGELEDVTFATRTVHVRTRAWRMLLPGRG
jgi:diacylglycerol kinase family enzyme